jgi:hypothetical protein
MNSKMIILPRRAQDKHVENSKKTPVFPLQGFAETPDGGILGSGRNGIFHGKGKCNCRGTVRSTDGGDTFGPLGFDPVLVEPECMVSFLSASASAWPRGCLLRPLFS